MGASHKYLEGQWPKVVLFEALPTSTARGNEVPLLYATISRWVGPPCTLSAGGKKISLTLGLYILVPKDTNLVSQRLVCLFKCGEQALAQFVDTAVKLSSHLSTFSNSKRDAMTLFLRALITALLVVSSLGCSCMPVSFDKSYCDSRTSFRATVLAETDNCVGKCHPINDQMDGAITYILKVSEVYKGAMPEDEVAYMRTPVNSGLCGVKLNVGSEYVFNLPYIAIRALFQCPSEYFSIGLCDSIEEWDTLPEDSKQFITDNVNNGQKLCGPSPPQPPPPVIEVAEETPVVAMTPQPPLTA